MADRAAHRTVIESMAVYLPPKIVSTSAILNGCTRPMTFPMEEFTGIRNRRMAGESEYSIDLARKAASLAGRPALTG